EVVDEVDGRAPAERGRLGLVAEVVVRTRDRGRRPGADAALAAVGRRADIAVVARRPVGRFQVGRADAGDAVALLGHIADVGRRAARRRAGEDGICRAGGARAGAALGDVARAGGRAARHGRRLERVGRAGHARAGAVFGLVAGAR